MLYRRGDTCTSKQGIPYLARSTGLHVLCTGLADANKRRGFQQRLVPRENYVIGKESSLPLMQFRIEPRRGSLATTTAPALLSVCLLAYELRLSPMSPTLHCWPGRHLTAH